MHDPPVLFVTIPIPQYTKFLRGPQADPDDIMGDALRFRLSKEDAENVRLYCDRNGITVSHFIRHCVSSTIRKIQEIEDADD